MLLSVLLCAGPLVWFTRPGALAKGLPSTDAGLCGFASRCFRECGRCVFCSTMRASSGGLALLKEELSSHFSFFDSNLRMPVVSFLARLFELSSPPWELLPPRKKRNEQIFRPSPDGLLGSRQQPVRAHAVVVPTASKRF